MKKTSLAGASKAAKENAQAKAPAAEPGMSALQVAETESSLGSVNTSVTRFSEAKAAAPPQRTSPLPTTEAEASIPRVPQPAPSNIVKAHNHANGTTPQFTQSTFAPMPGNLKPTPEPAVVPKASEMDNTVEARLDGEDYIEATEAKLEKDDKEWEKLPKQDTAATSLLGDSTLPADLDWIETDFVQYYEEMGRKGFTDTAQVHPLHFTTAIAELARSAGVEIRTGAKVTNFTKSITSPNFNVVEYVDRRNGDEIRSIDGVTDVIVTAGPWTGKLLPRSKIEGLRAHSVVYEADVSPYAVFTDIQLPGDYIPEHRARAGQKRKHRGNVDPEVYARPFGEVYACGEYSISRPYIEGATSSLTFYHR